MANEITLTLSLSYIKDGTSVSMSVSNKLITVTGKRIAHIRQNVGTAVEALDLGDIATGGWFFAVNRDSTNFVEIRSSTTGVDLIRLNAGEACCLRMSADSAAPAAIADTAAVDLEFLLIEN